MNALRWQRERRSATHTPTTMTGSMNSWSLVEDDELYRDIKAQAHDAVDAFIHAHRQELS